MQQLEVAGAWDGWAGQVVGSFIGAAIGASAAIWVLSRTLREQKDQLRDEREADAAARKESRIQLASGYATSLIQALRSCISRNEVTSADNDAIGLAFLQVRAAVGSGADEDSLMSSSWTMVVEIGKAISRRIKALDRHTGPDVEWLNDVPELSDAAMAEFLRWFTHPAIAHAEVIRSLDAAVAKVAAWRHE